jgi:hypothetical protein
MEPFVFHFVDIVDYKTAGFNCMHIWLVDGAFCVLGGAIYAGSERATSSFRRECLRTGKKCLLNEPANGKRQSRKDSSPLI